MNTGHVRSLKKMNDCLTEKILKFGAITSVTVFVIVFIDAVGSWLAGMNY